MNLPAVTKTTLPAHLQHLAQNTQLMAMNTAASAGISSGGWPRISIKGSRFRLQHPQGEEVVVRTLDLDVIIVDANPHGLSKLYYKQAYDPKTDDGSFKAPDCWSDNGVGPSSKSTAPQCGTCAACPHNVWGSKITPNGAQTKACSDMKKLAVLIAANPDGPVFELRVPPASLKNWAAYIDQLSSRGIPAASVVTKLKFDTNADFPKLVFECPGYIDEVQAKVVMEVIGTEEVDQCTGKNDRPIDATKALPAPAVQHPAGRTPPPNPNFPHNGMPPQAPIAAPRVPTVADAAPASAPPQPLASTPVVDAVAKRTRGRKPAAPQAPTVADAPPPFLANVAPPNAAQQAAPLAPSGITDSALDDMIARAMQV